MSPVRSTQQIAKVTVERSRFGEWIRRYGPAELAGILTALLGSYFVFSLTRNEIAAAFGGSIGENVGFYGVILGRETWADRRACRSEGRAYGWRGWFATLVKLGMEFGIAEILDSGVIRPLAMAVATSYLGRQAGVIVGKLAADVTFYVPVILTYEIRRSLGRSSTES